MVLRSGFGGGAAQRQFRRESFLNTFAGGLRAGFLPAVAILVLTYGALVWKSAREETALRRATDRIIETEGRYLAERLGRFWPGKPVIPKE